MIRKTSLVLGIAAVHFIMAKIIVAFTMQMGMFATGSDRAAESMGRFMVEATRVLYFPVITLSLYSRNWFPGNWLLVPVVVNSLLWGIAIYGLIHCLKRVRSR
ncbi:MAG: hypothetical protein U5R30_07730 [Deltaproteobacteria bacterium]|jgi:hypothetical protein|nr:hypothetical protein [Deltaproteobacteria bacterium]